MAAETSLPPGDSSVLDRMFAKAEAARPGQSAFRLLSEGPEAFAVRAGSAGVAERSVDVQTYIWRGDLTGLFLAHQLLQAADRGVKVRLLIDDMDARARSAGFAALEYHDNISVRLFNPFRSRRGWLGFVTEGISSFRRINHRMHNKSWIADNRVAVVGGRNLGDEYFDASEQVNFIDLDFVMVGPVVRDISASFDRYWNSSSAYPIETLDGPAVNAAALSRFRAALAEAAQQANTSRYAEALRKDDSVSRLAEGEWSVEWTDRYQFVADDPLKATLHENDPRRSEVMRTVAPLLRDAQRELRIVSPYFVPGRQGAALLRSLAAAGREVRILTNSLAANDVAAVHGGYSRYRRRLLAAGVHMWELKPTTTKKARVRVLGKSIASLHTKALSVDGHSLFVGSYNLDPRSTWLNCEQGVWVCSPALVAQFATLFEAQTAGERAWRLVLEDHRIHWMDGVQRLHREPQTTWPRKLQALLARWLRLEAQL